MLLQNFFIQIAALFLGLFAGIIVSWLAEEELLLYKERIHFLAKIFFILTLLAPIFFVEKWILAAFMAVSYGVIAFPKKNEVQVFYFIAPLALFLSTQSKEGFFVGGGLFLIATLLTTILFFTAFVKKKQIVWKKECWLLLAREYASFVLLSGLLYSGVFVVRIAFL